MTDRFTDERMLCRDEHRNDPSFWTDRSREGMIATAHYRATQVGAEILGRGGNAVDAAVGASLALGVCEPLGSGLGGMGMMTIHLASGRTFTLQGPCLAPKRATPEQVASSNRYRGYRAVAIPTLVALIAHALSKYGTLKPAEVLSPSIGLAEEGFLLGPLYNSLTKKYSDALANRTAASMFLDPNKEPFPEGHLLKQPALARTLRRMAKAGFADFYTGEIGRVICEDMALNGGFVGKEDLRDIPVPKESPALSETFGDWEVCTLGPPGGGIPLLEMMKLHHDLPDPYRTLDTPRAAVLLSRIIRHTRQDRKELFFKITHGEPTQDLLEAEYIHKITGELVEETGETTHLSVADREGNLVSMTQSIERVYGSCEMSPALGFLYNGYLRAFKVENAQHPHYLRPRSPARSNAAPTIVLEKGRGYAAVGSTGSERMSSAICQVLLRLEADHSPWEAVHAPRMHCDPNGNVMLEAGRFAPEIVEELEKHSTSIRRWKDYSFKAGGLQLVVRNHDEYIGVGEPRRDGAALGPI